MNRGFILLDATIAYVILAFAMVSLIPLFILSIRANKNSERGTIAAQLSIGLLEEIRLRKWDKNSPADGSTTRNPSNNLGPDNGDGENATDKRTYDDIDDFTGWTESPPKDPVMNNLNQFSAYSSSVVVQYVTASLANSSSRTDYKKITVCTWQPKMKSVCLETIRTNH